MGKREGGIASTPQGSMIAVLRDYGSDWKVAGGVKAIKRKQALLTRKEWVGGDVLEEKGVLALVQDDNPPSHTWSPHHPGRRNGKVLYLSRPPSA